MKGKQDVWNKGTRSEGFMGQGKCCSEVEWLVWRYNVKRKRGKHFDDGNECLLLWHRIAWWVVEETTGLWPRLDKTGCLRTNLLVIWGSSEKDGDLKPNWNLKKNKQKKPTRGQTHTNFLRAEYWTTASIHHQSRKHHSRGAGRLLCCGWLELMWARWANDWGRAGGEPESLRARPRDKCQHCHRCLNVCVNGWQQTCKDDLNL